VANTELELDMLLWFCANYLQHVDLKTKNKSLQNILVRQFQKMEKLSKKLHEDLQFDYQQESDKIYKLAQETTNWFNL
jgi:oxalate decarboxylase/phosphoglucose isomerase-like protein (cupin superfamily)